MSSPPGYPHPGTSSPSKPIAIIPLSSGGHSVGHKRRQSMDTKLGTRQQHNNFPSNPRHYSSQHSTGWRSKLGSFLKKNNAGQVQSEVVKTDSKGPLRRSQSDDSLLSSHSTRPDEAEEKVDTKSSDGVHSLDPPTLRKGSSPRSPRPVGRIFSSQENLDVKGSDQVITSTPDSIPTPSLETNPSSHNPFSGLDSDFPGVMGESGLGFNPLQYSPTFLSDSGIPELPQASDDCHIPDSNGYNTELPGHISEHEDEEIPRKSIGSLDDIKPVKQPDQMSSKKIQQNSNPSEDHMAELNTLYINSKIEDILNANVKIKEIDPSDGLDNSDDVFQTAPAPSKSEVKRDKFQAVVDVLATYSKNRTNDAGNVFLKQKSVDSVDETAKSRRSYYWKTEEVDSISEIDKLNLEDNKGMESPKALKRTQKQPTVLDIPQTGSYSVQYACSHQHNSNGMTQQSITATFVQDRPVDPKMRRPHSIRRCMDIPPTEVTRTTSRLLQGGQSSKQHHRSIHDITRRHKAYAAWVTQHQKDNDDNKSPRLHYRSLSTGDELDLESPRPVPAPRSASVKPVPVPRRSHGYLDKVKYAKKFNDNATPSTTHDHTVSAPSTPVDSQHHITNILPSVKSTSYQHVSGSRELPQTHTFMNPICLTKHNEPVTKPTEDNILSSTRSPLLRKQKSAPGIVSPSDNVCASTVLSWV